MSDDTQDAVQPATPAGTARVIVCDDEDLLRTALAGHLADEGFVVDTAANGQECLEAVLARAPDAVLLDLHMPVMDGLTCLRKLREAGSRVPVIVLTAHGGVDSAIEATRLGAAAYIPKPFDMREVSLQLTRVIERESLAREIEYLRERERARYGQMVGNAPAMRAVFDTLRRLEGVDAPTVLVFGESGTGKELVAQAIHAGGPRKDGPFVAIDCASLPETLIESELFGHERGAFTDARQQKRGLFEVARGGTVFLDEIGEIPIGTQAKLLRALENRRAKRVGGVTDYVIDVGVVAATNRDLAKEVEAGRFRRDLYYRLAVIPIDLPPLRARAGDIPALVAHFLEHFGKRIPGRLVEIAPQALDAMVAYRWPGNIRELRNVIERIATLYRDDARIEPTHLPPEVRFARAVGAGVMLGAAPAPSSLGTLASVGAPGNDSSPAAAHGLVNGTRFVLPLEGVDLDTVEKGFVVQALERTSGNQTAAAKLLGISRYALRNRIEKFGLKAAHHD